MNAAAAAFQAAKTSGMGMLPPMAMPMVSAAAVASAANLTVPSVSTPNASHADSGSRAASAARARSSTPSGAGTPQLKRAKHEPEDDGELEIDVQNDDARSMPSASHTNGTSAAGSSKVPKDGRESAQSVSSRDSTTPKSGRQVSSSCLPLMRTPLSMGPANTHSLANDTRIAAATSTARCCARHERSADERCALSRHVRRSSAENALPWHATGGADQWQGLVLVQGRGRRRTDADQLPTRCAERVRHTNVCVSVRIGFSVAN